MTQQPLLSLVMIVKNEALNIEALIDSVRGVVDCYTILDTGSTDGTQERIRSAFGSTPGRVLSEPFVDFGATRNRALDLADPTAVFHLMLSGDEVLLGGETLRLFCEAHRDDRGPEHEAYMLRMIWGDTSFDLPRLTRAGGLWRYAGSTHEVLLRSGASPPINRVDGAAVRHDVVSRDQARKRLTWERDIELLTADLKADPDNARATFYLARTYDDLGQPNLAHRWFRRRIELGGWHEEVYESLFRLACTARVIGESWPLVQQMFLDAHAHSPHRTEPLLELAAHWYEAGVGPLAHLFAQRAAALPFPAGDRLFVQQSAYGARRERLVGLAAASVGEWEVAEKPLRRALALEPFDPFVLRALGACAERIRESRASKQRWLQPLKVIAQMETVPGYFTAREGELLLEAAQQALRRVTPPAQIVEVGSYQGRSTVVLAHVARAHGEGVCVYAVDPHTGEMELAQVSPGSARPLNTFDAFVSNVTRFGLGEQVVPVRQYSFEVDWAQPIAFLFIDGLHDQRNVSRDFEHFFPHLANGGLVAFHDYESGWPGVRVVVDRLIADRRVKPIGNADSLIIVEAMNG